MICLFLSLLLLLILRILYPSFLPIFVILPPVLSLKIWGLNEGLLALLITFMLVVVGSRGDIQFSSLILGFIVSLVILLFLGNDKKDLAIQKESVEEKLLELRERKEEMEERLYESQTLITSLISNVPGAIYRCAYSEHWTIEFISDAIFPLSGYCAHDFIKNRKITFLDLIYHEDYQYVKGEIIEQVNKGELYDLEYRILRKDGDMRWIKERGQGVRREDGAVLWLDGVLMDITEERLAQEELSKEKRRLDVTLRSIGEGVIVTDEKGRIILFNKKAEEMTGWREDETLYQSVFSFYRVVDKKSNSFEHPVKKVLRTREKIHISSNKGLLTRQGDEISVADSAAPIMYDGDLHGAVLVFRDITKAKEDASERAKLLEETKRGLNESLSLQMVTAALLQMISLEEVLELVCSEAEALTSSSGSCVFLIEEEDWLSPVFSSGEISFVCQQIPIKNSLTGLAVKSGEPVVSNQYKMDDRKFIGDVEVDPENLLAVPLALKDEIIGALTILNKPGGFQEDDVRIISLFANQASVAIENARLYKKAQELAAMKERQRLARDLHDAVSQTLFSASLIAEVLPGLWEKNREEGLLRLEELKEMTRGALAEMRGLLLELRPQGLVETGMEELIHYLSDAVKGRARIPVSVEFEGDAALPSDVHVGFYRMIQESLNNIIKHSGATEVKIKMRMSQEVVFLGICDNGIGFEPEKVSQDRFGLKIMMERANEIGARLTIESELGQGTTIEALWVPQREEDADGRNN